MSIVKTQNASKLKFLKLSNLLGDPSSPAPGRIPLIKYLNLVHKVLCGTSRDFIHKSRRNSSSFQNRMSGQKSFYSHNQQTLMTRPTPLECERRGPGCRSFIGGVVSPLLYLCVCISTDILSLFLLGVYLNSQRAVWHQGQPVRVITK